nr:MAG: hypothetical protein [Bacteriophage sp.]
MMHSLTDLAICIACDTFSSSIAEWI